MVFVQWLAGESLATYGSYGNGSAMRVSPVGFAFNSLDEVLEQAEKSAAVTHNHPEGIKGAQAVASAIFLARKCKDKSDIREYIEEMFNYNLHQRIDDIRHHYRFNETCQGSVPQSILAFLESNDYEDAVRKAISLGGDSDTMACIAGGIAQAYYCKISDYIIKKVRTTLTTGLLAIVDEFYEKYGSRVNN